MTDKVMESLSNVMKGAPLRQVVCRLRGGLGNQIFQICAAIYISKQQGAEITVLGDTYDQSRLNRKYVGQPTRKFELDNLFGSRFLPDGRLHSLSSGLVRLVRAEHSGIARLFALGHTPQMLVEYKNKFVTIGRSDKAIVLDGYWQSGSLIDAVRNELFQFLDIDKKLIAAGQAELNRLGSGPFVGVHVRRGDYVSGLFDTIPLTIDYYERAIGLFPNHIPLIFSDDIDWCRQNLKLKDARFWSNDDALATFIGMSLCSGNIVANSTFSLWAALLSRDSKMLVGPKSWFKEESPYFGANKYILPSNWISV